MGMAIMNSIHPKLIIVLERKVTITANIQNKKSLEGLEEILICISFYPPLE
tara:strand:- start:498 stop:650 length:153 start_codon:yes stop_codon:yes gene_type:complete